MGERRPGRDREQRLTLAEAAEVLGVSKDGVRMRVRRGTLRSEKGEDGRVYVFVVPDQGGVPPEISEPNPSRELIEEMRGRIEDLREQLAAEREAHREARRIIGGLVQRVPELEAPGAKPKPPQEAREASLSPEGEPPASTPQEDRGGPERGVERPQSEARGPSRPWWRRLLGG